jgi:predicted DNA-binding transcriptional regulator AlpA
MLNDPFPRQLLLGAKEMRMLLGMDKSAWGEFLANPPPEFPRAVAVGKTASGNDRPRWKKAAVYNWLDTLREAQPAGKPSESARRRPKPSGAVEPPDDEG